VSPEFQPSAYDWYATVVVQGLGGFGLKNLDAAFHEETIGGVPQTSGERLLKGTVGGVELAATALPIGRGITAIGGRSLAITGAMAKGSVFSEAFEGGLAGIERRFAEVLKGVFKRSGGEFGGFANERMVETQFLDAENVINFQRTAHMTKGTVAEEVQHALDKALFGVTESSVLRAGAADTAAGGVRAWWHRRVFTRLIKNVNKGQYGLEYLQPRINELYDAYKAMGGKLKLEEILTREFKGPF
jgi:hypothetical protein